MGSTERSAPACVHPRLHSRCGVQPAWEDASDEGPPATLAALEPGVQAVRFAEQDSEGLRIEVVAHLARSVNGRAPVFGLNLAVGDGSTVQLGAGVGDGDPGPEVEAIVVEEAHGLPDALHTVPGEADQVVGQDLDACCGAASNELHELFEPALAQIFQDSRAAALEADVDFGAAGCPQQAQKIRITVINTESHTSLMVFNKPVPHTILLKATNTVCDSVLLGALARVGR